MKTIDELRVEIQSACDAAIARGLKISADIWGVGWRNEDGALEIPDGDGACVCPMGALAIARDVKAEVGEDDIPDENIIMAGHLGLKTKDVEDFTSGFDGVDMSRSDFAALGREFRAKFVLEEEDDDEGAP